MRLFLGNKSRSSRHLAVKFEGNSVKEINAKIHFKIGGQSDELQLNGT